METFYIMKQMNTLDKRWRIKRSLCFKPHAGQSILTTSSFPFSKLLDIIMSKIKRQGQEYYPDWPNRLFICSIWHLIGQIKMTYITSYQTGKRIFSFDLYFLSCTFMRRLEKAFCSDQQVKRNCFTSCYIWSTYFSLNLLCQRIIFSRILTVLLWRVLFNLISHVWVITYTTILLNGMCTKLSCKRPKWYAQKWNIF